jgi:hypothetical protein
LIRNLHIHKINLTSLEQIIYTFNLNPLRDHGLRLCSANVMVTLSQRYKLIYYYRNEIYSKIETFDKKITPKKIAFAISNS